MRVSQLMQRSAAIYPNLPLLTITSITDNKNTHDDNSYERGNGNGNDNYDIYEISYRDGFHQAMEYKIWIQHLISEAVAGLEFDLDEIINRKRTRNENFVDENGNNCNIGVDVDVDVDVVVAILSHNSPDLFLAMMGCLDVTNTCISQQIIASSSDDEGASRGNVNLNINLNVHINVTTAMLNVRWSPKEIASSIKIQEEKDGDDGVRDQDHHHQQHHLTIILCSREMEKNAREACRYHCHGDRQITSEDGESISNHNHDCRMARIPLLNLNQMKIIIHPHLNEKNEGRNNAPPPSLWDMQDFDGVFGQAKAAFKIQNTLDSNTNTNTNTIFSNPNSNGNNNSIRDDAILLFTSGTTSGRPKGVRLSHLSLILQAMAKTTTPCHYNSNTRMLASTVPFFHVGGLSSALAIVMAGGTLCLPVSKSSKSRSGFDPHQVLQCMIRIRADIVSKDNDHVASLGFQSESKQDLAVNQYRKMKLPPGYTGTRTETSSSSLSHHCSIDINTLVIVPAMLHAIIAAIEENDEQYRKSTHIASTSASKSLSTSLSLSSTSTSIYPNVRLLLVGGQSITLPQLNKSKQYFPNARIVQTFACTEAGSSITFATIYNPEGDTGAKPNGTKIDMITSLTTNTSNGGILAGFPPHHIELKIFKLDENNLATSKVAGVNQIGAIGTRGPHVMNGYWTRGRKRKTSNHNLTSGEAAGRSAGKGIDNYNDNVSDEWLIMNDLGYLDDIGQLYFCGRSNDVIRSGGETVFAPEVENTIIRHRHVDQCAVFALPDDKFGERVCAAIVVVPTRIDANGSGNEQAKRKVGKSQGYGGGESSSMGAQVPESMIASVGTNAIKVELRSFCAEQNLSGYKRPQTIFMCRELPRNASGKVLKHELAALCAKTEAARSRL